MKTYDDLTQKINSLSGQLFNLYTCLEDKYSHDLDVVTDLLKVAYQTLDIYFLTDCTDVEKRDVDLPLKSDDDELPF